MFTIGALETLAKNYLRKIDTFINTLDCYAPLKKKKIRSNHSKFMTKKRRKKVMTRDPVCAISIIKIAHTRTGQTIKSNVTFAQTF